MYYIFEMNNEDIRKISDSLSEKLNIYLSDSTLDQLTNDALGFLIKKKDNVPNRNKFCNLLIYNYLDQYMSQISKCSEETYALLEKTFPDSKRTLIKSLSRQIAYKNLVTATSDQGRSNKTLSLKIDNLKKTRILEALCSNLDDVDLSVFFRGLFQSYLSLPVYQREQIIYADRISSLDKAIHQEVSITYKNASTGKQNFFFPKLIQHSQHEYYNYVLGQFDNSHHGIGSIRIANLNDLYLSQRPANFSDEFEETIQRRKRNGVQFSYRENEIPRHTITLTKEGYNKYLRRYLERPKPTSISSNNDDGSVTLEFDCSEFQFNSYFKPFENSFKVEN